MGTQSESLKPSSRTPRPETLRGTGEANSAFDIFHFRRPTETKKPSDVSPEVRFSLRSAGYASDARRPKVLVSELKDVFASGAPYCEARRGRDGASTDARSVGSRDEAGEGAGHAGARLGRRRVVLRDAGKRVGGGVTSAVTSADYGELLPRRGARTARG